MPRQLRKFDICSYLSKDVGIGGQGVEPHVRKNLGLPSGMGGIKVRLG
jgi:hypothetical protein